jgi:hypothetical protein
MAAGGWKSRLEETELVAGGRKKRGSSEEEKWRSWQGNE